MSGPRKSGSKKRFHSAAAVLVALLTVVSEVHAEVPGSLTIRVQPVADLIVTDPQGRKTGIDPVSNTTYAEIPGSNYGAVAEFADKKTQVGSPARVFTASQLDSGEYRVMVIGRMAANYTAEVIGADEDGDTEREVIKDEPTGVGLVHEYTLNFGENGKKFEISGAFNGGNTSGLLSFAAPLALETQLPAGTMSTPVEIFYANGLKPRSFSAKLNGKDISRQFRPRGGTHETVLVPLQSGDNLLQIEVSGTIANGWNMSAICPLTFKVQ